MNEQEIKEFFKNTFNTVADGYDSPALRFFQESAVRLPAYLGLQGDEHVLDIATGTGAGVMALAASLPYGRVTGIDFSEKMLSRAGRKITEQGLVNVELHEMDMQNIAFPDRHFDAASCCFALFFIEDMQEQLRHIASKVREGGKVIITSFYKTSFSPPVDVFFSCLERYGIEPPNMTWKRVATTKKCTSLFEEAGLKNVAVDRVDSGYALNSPEEWWQIVWNGGFRGLVAQLDEEDLARFRKEHLAEISDLANGDGIRIEMGIIYSVGTI
ncbi:MAG: class I SAM-dependent methyltransferase [Thermodesulfobacteriota bacterium]